MATPGLAWSDPPTKTGDEPEPQPRISGGTLEHVVQALEAELALAESRSYYLVLDPSPSRLRLMHRGVLLHEIDVTSVEVGTPRVLFSPRSDPALAFDRVWSIGRLSPERQRVRTEIDPSPDSTDVDDVAIPPLPEDLYPTPDRFWVRYPDGLAIEFAPDSTASEPAPGRRLSEFFASLWARDRWRIRLAMDDEEVGSLYRSIPDSCGFLFVSTPTRKQNPGEAAKNASKK